MKDFETPSKHPWNTLNPPLEHPYNTLVTPLYNILLTSLNTIDSQQSKYIKDKKRDGWMNGRTNELSDIITSWAAPAHSAKNLYKMFLTFRNESKSGII